MANGRYTQNIFTPQVEPYDIGGDILKAMMREQGMRRERESQVMEMAQYMDPVKLTSDALTYKQHEMISTVGDDIAAKMKAKKGRLTTDDMLNIQFQIRGVREWQQQALAKQDIFTKETAAYQDPRNANKYDQSVYGQRSLDYVTKGTFPADGTFLDVNAIPFYDTVHSAKLFDEKNASVFSTEQFIGEDKAKTKSVSKTIYGPYTPNSPFSGTVQDDAWLSPRMKFWSTQLLSSEAHMKGARQAFNQLPQEEQAGWNQQALAMNSTPNLTTLDAQGNPVQVDGAYMWGVDYASKNMQSTKMKEEIGLTSSSLLPKPPKTEDEAGAIEWVGESGSVKRNVKFLSKSGKKEVVYEFEDTAIIDVQVGGVNSARVKIEGDYFITAGDDDWFGMSINSNKSPGKDEKGNDIAPPSDVIRGKSFKIAKKPEILKGMQVYMGENDVLEKFVTKEMGRKGEFGFGNKDADMEFVHGKPIDKEIYDLLKEEAKTNTKAKEIFEQIEKKNVARIYVETGTRDNVELMRVYDEDLAKELGSEFFEYKEKEYTITHINGNTETITLSAFWEREKEKTGFDSKEQALKWLESKDESEAGEEESENDNWWEK